MAGDTVNTVIGDPTADLPRRLTTSGVAARNFAAVWPDRSSPTFRRAVTWL